MELGTIQLFSGIAIVCGALVIIAFERVSPYNRGQAFFREGFWLDFWWYTLFQSFLLGLLISELIYWIDSVSGLSRYEVVSDWPIWGQLLFFLLTHDLYIYLFHKAQHHSKFLYRFHEAHHSVKDVDWVAGSRSHPIEILINQTIEFAPMVLLGAHPAVPVLKGAISGIWGMYIHSNINMNTGIMQYIINGPEMHRYHHAISDVKAFRKNFATKFAFWDWIFNTAYLPQHQKATEYGLGYSSYPKDYWGQIVHAFRFKKKRRARG